jgi:hypothetical protein
MFKRRFFADGLRHVAVLALAGWYLMVPPIVGTAPPDETAPLSKWKVERSFDTADDCSYIAGEFTDDGMRRVKLKQSRQDIILGIQYLNATCISTDDPRLKEK